MWLIKRTVIPLFLLAVCDVTWGKVSEIDLAEQTLDKIWSEWDKVSENILEDEPYAREFFAQRAADAFNRGLKEQVHLTSLALWNYTTNINDQTSAAFTDRAMEEALWRRENHKEMSKYNYYSHYSSQELIRMLKVIAVSGAEPDPTDDQQLRRKINLSNELSTIYSSAKYNGKSLDPDLNEIMATSRDQDKLLDTWLGWRTVSGKVMRSQFDEFVSLLNQGAVENGFSDYGDYLRLANYEREDMAAGYKRTHSSGLPDIEAVVDDLWVSVKPLYEQLHAYVKRKLAKFYPELSIDEEYGTIPAHILGNMWGQEWGEIYDILEPYPDEESMDVTPQMVKQGWTIHQMVQTADNFFTSIGLEPMTDTFWRKSVFNRPSDGRNMVCHASAEDFFAGDDFRIKMCAHISQADLNVIHHEMGHIEYFMEYKNLDAIYRKGANSGYHEAIGDTIALSVMTPAHLHTLGLLPQPSTNHRQTINFLMKMALDKIAFLPFGLMIDKYRWDIYRGVINNTNYNQKWWQYRKLYQGISSPVSRSENDFDPGAKFHVAENVPYIRYFLSFILQFQFQESLCDVSGHTGPLHECDIYRSKRAGLLLKQALSLGGSKYWRENLRDFTGRSNIDPSSIKRYFQPLTDWLIKQNQGHHVGWR